MPHLDDWPDPRLFDAWYLTEEYSPQAVAWPAEMEGWSTRQKELWGVQQVGRAIFAEMDGARIIHRGDSPVWQGDFADQSWLVPGDLDVAWEGRSPIIEVKAGLPAVRLRKEGKPQPPCQGLDWPKRQSYLNEQQRTGRPFYVIWVWPNEDPKSITVRGERVDRLDWPPPCDSINRRRAKGWKMAYWYVERLRSVPELAFDIKGWAGFPLQLNLVGA